MLPGRFSMKLNINSEKLFQNGAKNPAMLAGVVILYGAAMALAVIKSIRDSEGGKEAAGK
jgi:hypothetical protein